jgi:hypothetical protein
MSRVNMSQMQPEKDLKKRQFGISGSPSGKPGLSRHQFANEKPAISLLDLFCHVDDFCRQFVPDWVHLQLTSGTIQRHRSEQLKNILQIEHTRHRSVNNFVVNLVRPDCVLPPTEEAVVASRRVTQPDAGLTRTDVKIGDRFRQHGQDEKDGDRANHRRDLAVHAGARLHTILLTIVTLDQAPPARQQAQPQRQQCRTDN